MKSQMNAVTLRNILIAMVFITLAIAGGGFYYIFGWIHSYSESVNSVVVVAQQSSGTSSSLSELQGQIDKQQEIITAVSSLFALSSTYQTQAIKDIYTYASKADLTVSDIKLSDSAATPTASPTTPTTLSGTKPIVVSLTSPVGYTNLLRFLTYIEGNIPKMQVSGVEMSRPADGSSQTVMISTVTVNVYVK